MYNMKLCLLMAGQRQPMQTGRSIFLEATVTTGHVSRKSTTASKFFDINMGAPLS